MSVDSYAHVLAEYRARNIRASEDVLKKGIFILERNALEKLGSEGACPTKRDKTNTSPLLLHTVWPFLEQLALSALDLGHLDVANVRRLSTIPELH
jgi:hypothetical protein